MIAASKSFFKILLILFCIGTTLSLYGQQNNALSDEVKQNGTLFNENLDKAFNQIDPLLKKAKNSKNYSAELILLDRKCRYYYSKNQIDDLIVLAEELNSRALSIEDVYFEAMANIYLAEAYSINGFHDRAIPKLDKAYAILKNDKSGQKKIFLAKTNVLNSYANIYSDKGEPKKAIQKLHEVIKSYNELNKDDEIKHFQYVNYSNIASLYGDSNSDSARYFALKSIELKPRDKKDDGVMMMNYFLLGKAYKDDSQDNKAIKYYHKALEVSENTGLDLNKKLVYTSLVDLYKKTSKKDSAIIFENKLKQLQISMLESKYNSLKKVIVEDQKAQKAQKNKSDYRLYILLAVIVIVITATFYFVRKQRNKTRRSPQESYATLVDLANSGDPSFMFTFEQVFPAFSDKLLKINPDLQKSEIEFCALLKLNLSTKEIAKTTYIETKTVQNKKYRIRKKLNIPPNTDIYVWFSGFE
ncbi:tetratricopeptide repeat protein [Chryseobacterium sp. FH1]|uniref:tetratricopeptide repeat protein n=1 Tax=Chryseobacterium sp. FH1 TaxID=1233951 RepID=UPI000691D82C|nr:hypothetical protein [Chryseobacterium sp. FH1]